MSEPDEEISRVAKKAPRPSTEKDALKNLGATLEYSDFFNKIKNPKVRLLTMTEEDIAKEQKIQAKLDSISEKLTSTEQKVRLLRKKYSRL